MGKLLKNSKPVQFSQIWASGIEIKTVFITLYKCVYFCCKVGPFNMGVYVETHCRSQPLVAARGTAATGIIFLSYF